MSDPFKAPPPLSPEQEARIAEFDRLDAEWDKLSNEERIAKASKELKKELKKVPALLDALATTYGEGAFFSARNSLSCLIATMQKKEKRRNRICLKYVPLPQEGVALWAVVYHPGHEHVDGHRWWDQEGTILATFATNQEAFDMMMRCAARMQATPSFDHYPGVGDPPEDPVYFTLRGEQKPTIYRGTLAHVGCLIGVREGARVLDTNDPRISMDVRSCEINVGAGQPVDEWGHRPGHFGADYDTKTGIETWTVEEAPMWWLEPWGQDPNWVAPPPEVEEEEAA